jgi:hypothetical protein
VTRTTTALLALLMATTARAEDYRVTGDVSGRVRLDRGPSARVEIQLDSGLRLRGQTAGSERELRFEGLEVTGQREGLASAVPFAERGADRTPARARVETRGDRLRIALYDAAGKKLGEGAGRRDFDAELDRALVARDGAAIGEARLRREQTLRQTLGTDDPEKIDEAVLGLLDRRAALRDPETRRWTEGLLGEAIAWRDTLDARELGSDDPARLDALVDRLRARHDALVQRRLQADPEMQRLVDAMRRAVERRGQLEVRELGTRDPARLAALEARLIARAERLGATPLSDEARATTALLRRVREARAQLAARDRAGVTPSVGR